MLVITMSHIWNSLKSLCQTCPDLILPSVLIATRTGSSWHIEDAIICEIALNGIKIVAIERFQESLQQLTGNMIAH
jgi:hypothetical protein